MATKLSETSKLRSNTGGLLGMLSLQFLLGMVVNLWVKVPTDHPGTSGDNFLVRAAQGVLIMVHGISKTKANDALLRLTS
jgi:hypothetical protein